MAKSITLVVNFETLETKEFFQPEHIVGSVTLEALTLGQKMQKKGDEIEGKDLKEIATLVANKLYAKEFTVDQLIDGIHAPNLIEALMEQLGSTFGSDSGNASKAKKR